MSDQDDEKTPLTGGPPRAPASQSKLSSGGALLISVLVLGAFLSGRRLGTSGGESGGGAEQTMIHAGISPLEALPAQRDGPLHLPRGAGPILVTGGA